MPALTPRQAHEQFTEAFLVHDPVGLMSLYDEGATIMDNIKNPADGVVNRARQAA